MNNFKKYGALIGLGSTTITFVTLFTMYFTKYSSLRDNVSRVFLNNDVRFVGQDIDGNVILDEIYNTKADEFSIADIMLKNSSTYKLKYNSAALGYALKSIKFEDKWYDANFESTSTFWSIHSPNYNGDKFNGAPNFEKKNFWTTNPKTWDSNDNDSMNYGISNLYLSRTDLVFSFKIESF